MNTLTTVIFLLDILSLKEMSKKTLTNIQIKKIENLIKVLYSKTNNTSSIVEAEYLELYRIYKSKNTDEEDRLRRNAMKEMAKDIVEYLLNKQQQYGNFFVSQMLVGLLPNILSLKILKDLGYKDNTKIKHLPKTEFYKIAKAIKKYTFKPVALYGYDRSQVTVGGVDLKEVNENLELIKLPNIYLCGEILDIDGMCGGYNLHFAFASAVHVSNAIINK